MPPPMYHRRLGMHDDVKVPVVKNIIFALKLVWETDKKLLICSLVNQPVETVFSLFVQNILFLKVLLGIIDAKGDYREYFKNLIVFLVFSVILRGINWYANYIKQVSVKGVLKGLNNKVFRKAIELDVSCYEDPEFYDKYQRATQILAWGLFDSVCSNAGSICAGIISLILIIGTVTTINPIYLLFLLPVSLVFVVEMYKSRLVYKRDKSMTTNDRIKAYVQRTVFLKDYSKYDIKNLSASTLGSDINSNFDKDNPINRDQARQDVIALLDRIANTDRYSLMVDSGNI